MDSREIPTASPQRRRRGLHFNRFLVILGITALVWLVLSMSEIREYPFQVKVAMTGYDNRRYAAVSADSALAFQAQATGFSALLFSLRRTPVVLTLDMHGPAVKRYPLASPGGTGRHLCYAVGIDDVSESLRGQLARYGVRMSGAGRDSLRLVLAARASKTLKVSIDNLKVSFADGYGLYGEPTVVPSEVTLYGPQESLDRIDALRLSPAAVAGVKASDSLRLPLEPVWEQYGNVVSSASHVQVYIPVQPYVERAYTVPVRVAQPDSTSRLQLYPDRVDLKVWVAWCDLATVSASGFDVEADYADVLSGKPHLEPRLVRFPEQVRVRSMEPSEIQYVVIR
ncbi:MAG: hypothetical protein J6I49_07730 [Bacteroidales bacterium]|nr:hypothetical protein [Bacteroidales bacterium]